jgi:hypothetical protein
MARLFSNIFLFLFIGFLIYSCQSKQSLTDLTINNNNAMSVILKFRISDTDHPVLLYWNTSHPDVVLQKELPPVKEQELVLFQLQPASNYAFLVTAGDDSELRSSDTVFFETPRMPYTLPKLNIVVDSGDVFDGYIMVRKVEDPAQQILINNQGDIVWYHQFDTVLSRFYSCIDNEKILSLHEEDLIVEFDLTGKILNTLKY